MSVPLGYEESFEITIFDAKVRGEHIVKEEVSEKDDAFKRVVEPAKLHGIEKKTSISQWNSGIVFTLRRVRKKRFGAFLFLSVFKTKTRTLYYQ